jgi:hypothetical protein
MRHIHAYKLVLFSLFIMTYLVNQEIVELLKCRIFNNMIFFGLKCRTIEIYQENGLFQCKMPFCIHNKDT